MCDLPRKTATNILCALVALWNAGAGFAQSTASAPASAPVPAGAGKVITTTQTLTGKVSFDGADFIVGTAKVSWSDVLIAIVNPDGQTLPASHAVRLADGELLRCQILGLSNHKLSVDFLGKRELGEDAVSALSFAKAFPEPAKPKTLYRLKDEAIPGSLVWIDAARLALDSPLGVVTIPRKAVAGYCYFVAAPASSAGIDELHLVDASILRGKAEPARTGVQLDHALLGKLELPWPAIRSLRRSHPAVGYVSSSGPITRKPLIAEPEQKPQRQSADGALAGQVLCPATGELGKQFFTVLQLQAGQQAQLGICQLSGQLRASVLPAAESRGSLRVRIETCEAQPKLLKELTVRPNDPAAELAVELPELSGAKAEIRVSVDFAGPALLPSGVVLGDLMVVSK
jgi:hypothetical protein